MSPSTDPWLEAADLVAQLTVDETIAFCHQHVPAVERLGLRPFVTGSEAAHGVAWLGTATVFPQPVGLAATWDVELIRRVGEAVGVELRAKHAEDPSISLNAWAPVVNPLRNPLWGRNEEGFSEDPHLTAELATAYARGLRGDHPTVWRTVPTLKHFLGYNNETDRDVSSSGLRPRVLAEYELPAYAGPIAAGVIGAVMPSYNLVNHRPAHVSHGLLDRLRAFTERSLLVVSDAYAPGNLAGSQHYFAEHVTSHAAALRAGVDSFTEGERNSAVITNRLTEALARGLITEADLALAATRLLYLRILTGELDPASDPYASITASDLDTPAHRALARESAAKSVVLLANAAGLLPLQTKQSVAVVGPFAQRVVHDWYSGTPPYLVGLTDALMEACSGEVRAADGTDVVTLLATSTQRYLSVDPDSGVVAAAAVSTTENERFVLDDWGQGTVTLTAVNGHLLTGVGGRHVTATATRVGGWEVQESFGLRRFDDGTWAVQHLGTRKWLRVQQQTGRLEAGAPDAESAEHFVLSTVVSGLAEVADAAAAADVVVVTAGNDPHLWGRETQDRPDLWLPSRHREILRTARAANPQCVLVIVSSYPYVLDASERTCPAIVWSSHAGQELGHGVADVLLGTQEPYGRLAQAWPTDPKQAGDLLDYDVIASRQTYAYADSPALFGFGHGLTYAEAAYGTATLGAGTLDTDSTATSLEIMIANPSDRATTEVVQVYARRTTPGRLVTPNQLVGHARVELLAGQESSVTVELDLTRLRVWDVRTQALVLLPGTYGVTVGRSVEDVRGHLSLTIAGEVAGPTRLGSITLRAADLDDLLDADLVPDQPLIGEAMTTRGQAMTASIDFWNLDLTGVHSLTVATRGDGGVIRLLHRPTTGDDAWRALGSADVGPSADWSDTAVRVDAEVTVTDLRIEIPAGLQLLTFR